ncbi:rod shape-determining protein MreC, partial [Cognatilysobacter lacus]
MPPSTAPARLGDAAGTLRLLAYLAAALALAVLDHRGGWMHTLRQQVGVVVEPVRALAGLPGHLVDSTTDNVATVAQLAHRNQELRRELLVSQARIARLSTVISDNSRLRALLDAAQRGGLDVQLAPILDVDLDPTHQRLLLDAGSGDGVREGQSVIDARGLLGQVTKVGPLHSDVLLITDPDHAVPVAVARNGVRLVAYGTGRNDLLSLASIPLSSDIKVGDVIVTSGLGGRFPPGFPVGRIVALRPDESRAFLEGDVRPAAQLDRGREVLLLRSNRVTLPMPPPPPQTLAGTPGEAGTLRGVLPNATAEGASATTPARS